MSGECDKCEEKALECKRKYLGWCPDIAKFLGIEQNCCETCHNDEDQGYSIPSQIEFEDGYYDICCKMKEILERHRPVP